MGVHGGPDIITDSSLILSYDVADDACWPNTGSTAAYNRVHDLSGNGHTGTLVNAAMATVSSSNSHARGRVMEFDGSSTYVSYSDQDLSDNPFSQEAWIYAKDWDNSVTRQIYTDNAGGNPLSAITLFPSDSGAGYENKISGLVRDGDGTVAYASGSSTVVSDTWYHVMFVRSGAAGSNTFQMYINGKLDCNMEGAAAANVAAVNGIGGDRIGGSPEGAISWLGSIGPFRIYNRSLNAEEALQNFNAQRGRFGL